jgi:hypothetical protein
MIRNEHPLEYWLWTALLALVTCAVLLTAVYEG